ncbi:MAG: hypothetical protein ACR2PB_03555 [Desulfocapsaceae bacterium]
MTYVIIGWISASVGFVLGAAWAGLGMKNREVDHHLAGKREDHYANAQQEHFEQAGIKTGSWSTSGSSR